MRVLIKEVQEGCILSEDVIGSSGRAIVQKKTVLTSELLEVLKAFLIPELEVEKTLSSGHPFIPNEILLDDEEVRREENEEPRELTFTELFLQASRSFKKEFRSWQSGLPVDVTKVRSIIFPLIEKIDHNQADLFQLHHFSTEEDYLYQHAVAVGLISSFISKKLGFNKGEIVQVALAGTLSDCGMAKLSEGILNKRTPLTQEEYQEVKNHPTYSYRLIQSTPFIREAGKIAIFQHHERLDGSGYPLGEKGQKIHQYAKIIGVADTFHAMTSQRLYRKKQSPFKVLEMMLQDLFGQFDIASIRALQAGIMNISIGSLVKLSNGQEAEILFIDDNAPTRPLVKVLPTAEIIHLQRNRMIFIDEVKIP